MLILALASVLAAVVIGVFYVQRRLVLRLTSIADAMRRLSGGDIDEDTWDQVEETLLTADLGVAASTDLMERLRARVRLSRCGRRRRGLERGRS